MKHLSQLRTLLPKAHSKKPEAFSSSVAAVVVAIGFHQNREEILLTKRTETVMTHKGQVGFPGGLWERTDRDLFETAVREAEEEVGLSRSDFTSLGALDPVTTRGDVWIYPWVGEVQLPYNFQLSREEVAKIIMLPVEVLLERGLKKVEVPINGFVIQSLGIEWEGELIWGATARILEQLRVYLTAKG